MFNKIKLKFYLRLLRVESSYRLYSLGNCTIGVWVEDGFMNSGCIVECYYHPNTEFEEFTVTGHSWGTGKWIYSKEVKTYRYCPTEHIDKFLELSKLAVLGKKEE